MATGTVCPHCRHQRRASDESVDAWICPNCYKKYYEPVEKKARPVSTAPAPADDEEVLLVACHTCGAMISPAAKACPRCGHPNRNAPSPIRTIVAWAALALGIISLFMPYFVLLFMVPATAVAALATIALGERKLGKYALVLAAVGLGSIAHTHYKIEKIAREAAAQMRAYEENAQEEARKLRRELNRIERESRRW